MKKSSNFKIGVVFGAVLGAVGALLFNPKTGEENRTYVRIKLAELREKLDEAGVEERAKEIFGTATEEGKKLYVSAQTELSKKLADLEKRAEKQDKNAYQLAVEEAIEMVRKNSGSPSETIAKLKDYFMS